MAGFWPDLVSGSMWYSSPGRPRVISAPLLRTTAISRGEIVSVCDVIWPEPSGPLAWPAPVRQQQIALAPPARPPEYDGNFDLRPAVDPTSVISDISGDRGSDGQLPPSCVSRQPVSPSEVELKQPPAARDPG